MSTNVYVGSDAQRQLAAQRAGSNNYANPYSSHSNYNRPPQQAQSNYHTYQSVYGPGSNYSAPPGYTTNPVSIVSIAKVQTIGIISGVLVRMKIYSEKV